jgi:hypothetical protein
VLEQAERYRLPFLAVEGAGAAAGLTQAVGVELEGAGIVLTALRRTSDGLEARVANESGEPVAAQLGEAQLELRPWEIRTVALR